MNKSDLRVALVHKNFAAWSGISNIGLGITAHMNHLYLRGAGIQSIAISAQNNVVLVDKIKAYNAAHEKPLTHVVISAPWLSTLDLHSMATFFKDIQFSVIAHSNIGFLQADANGVRLLRLGIELSKELPNLKIGGNSRRFVDWANVAYGAPMAYLPNLYPVAREKMKPVSSEGPLKIGIFGAVRPQKNILTQVAAAIAIRKRLNRPVELSISTGRQEGAGVIVEAARQMAIGVPGFSFCERLWLDWSDFKSLIREMDLMLQVSYTESFNVITADGISEGVASAVSDAITWAPDCWKADFDDALDIADIGERLLRHRELRELGLKALTKHNEDSLPHWHQYLLN